MTPRRIGATIALVLVVVAATFAIGDLHDDSGAASAPSPTTTSAAPTSTTSTTTTPPVDTTLTEVAQANVAKLDVSARLPDDVEVSSEATATADRLRATFAALSPERSTAPAIPDLRHPVEGRRRTITGWQFDNPTPWGNPFVMVVTEHQGAWLKVQIPARPNGSQGWVRSADVTLSTHRFHVEISVGTRTLTAFDGSAVLLTTSVVVGKAATPTPTGHFYVTDFEKKRRGSAYGPWILPLSAYSQALDSFGGGVPVVAMHGTNHPELIGRAASNGCIRLPDDAIDLLHNRLPLGTPVDIRP